MKNYFKDTFYWFYKWRLEFVLKIINWQDEMPRLLFGVLVPIFYVPVIMIWGTLLSLLAGLVIIILVILSPLYIIYKTYQLSIFIVTKPKELVREVWLNLKDPYTYFFILFFIALYVLAKYFN